MDAAFDDRDIQSVMSGMFDIRATRDEIREELRLIRWLLEDGDEEEEQTDS